MIGYILIGIVIGTILGYLAQMVRSAKLQAESSRIPLLEKQIEDLTDERSTLLVKLTKVETNLEAIENAEKRLSETFAKIGKDALSENAEEFRKAASTDFSTRQQHLSDLLKPVKDNLTKLEEFNRDLEEKRVGAYSSLETHVKNLIESEQFLRNETSQLVKALQQPTTRGAWGEQQLRRVLEMAGIEENVHFNEQVDMLINNEKRRADLVLHLADGKHIIVDSKAPVQIYMDVVAASTAKERGEKLKVLVSNMKTYAKELYDIQYWKYYGDSPGIVVMFIPSESILNAAMQADPTLWDECIKKRILLASPTTLIAILYSIAFGWRQENFAKNALAIRKLAEDIYERLATFGGHFQDLGKQLTKSIDKYNDALGSLDRSVLPSARKMNELGINPGKKVIPDLPQLETIIRTPQAPELLFSGNGEEPASNGTKS
ncbi:MAG: DNA recombination protein RmuC [Ignavibacteriota bacterium]